MGSFINMLTWWQWALLALVPPAIIALYFLKLKRQPLSVPSTYLWSRTIEDLHVNSLWQRLRQSLLLFLQLLLIALAIAIPAAIIARTTRAAVVEILGQEFVEALRAKGISEIRIGRHVVKNAMAMVLKAEAKPMMRSLSSPLAFSMTYAWRARSFVRVK